ncbi:hypothetical protein AUO94_17030 (plasmid) [Planococcus kocurii]|uniref:Uncharacterized protein n=1 Tax=Planococcus kocurii TaxID=1374 RepID=A0ABN4KC39_9BACL|nr:hypothetical protein [Planococcus sp. (in: firmicutes)]AMB56991.1 hypothetical protein AUO94_17030 [Planococcus kocurii]
MNVTYYQLCYIQNRHSIDFTKKISKTEIARKKDTFKSLIPLRSLFVGGALFSFDRNALSSSLHTAMSQ